MAPMYADETGLNELTRLVIGRGMAVHNALGAGFLEKVYENALAHELRKAGLTVAQQHRLTVVYDDIIVGEYTVDLLVEDRLIVELKAARALDEAHHAQCISYLKGSGLKLALLLNFGAAKLQFKRVVNGL